MGDAPLATHEVKQAGIDRILGLSGHPLARALRGKAALAPTADHAEREALLVFAVSVENVPAVSEQTSEALTQRVHAIRGEHEARMWASLEVRAHRRTACKIAPQIVSAKRVTHVRDGVLAANLERDHVPSVRSEG
jgi:hypothetical protein